MNYQYFYKKDKRLKLAIKKIENKLAKIDWQQKTKLDPNFNYDLIYRLQERAWSNCFKCLDLAYDNKNGYELTKFNNLPVFKVTN